MNYKIGKVYKSLGIVFIVTAINESYISYKVVLTDDNAYWIGETGIFMKTSIRGRNATKL